MQKRDEDLLKAVWDGNPYEVKSWLEQGSHPDARDDSGCTPLMIAVDRHGILTHHNFNSNILATQNYYNIIKLLIDFGANIEAKDSLKMTPLMNAVLYDDVKLADVFLRQGADIEARNADNMTALMLATQNGSVNCVKKLVLNGANLSAEMRGNTALDIAKYLKNLNFGNNKNYEKIINFLTYAQKQSGKLPIHEPVYRTQLLNKINRLSQPKLCDFSQKNNHFISQIIIYGLVLDLFRKMDASSHPDGYIAIGPRVDVTTRNGIREIIRQKRNERERK